MWRRVVQASKPAAPLAAVVAACSLTMRSATPDAAHCTDLKVDKYSPNPRMWVHDALEGEGRLFKKAMGVDAATAVEKLSNMLIFAGSSNPTLAEEIAYELHRPLGKAQVGKFADGEVNVQVNENVRGRDVYIVQSTSTPVNENLMELLLMVSAMRRASARTITAVVPYYGYKREIGSVSNWTHLMRLEQEADGEASEAVTNERGERGSTGGARTLPAFVPTKGVAVAAAAAGDASAHRQPTPSDIILEATEPVGVLFRQYAASSPTASSASATAAAAAAGAAVKAVDVQHAEQPAAAPSAWTPSAQVGLPQVSIPIAAADVARMLEEMGVDRVVCVELQPPGNNQIEGFFDDRVRVENLRATALAVDYLSKLHLQSPVVVAPTEVCMQLATDFQSGLGKVTKQHIGLAAVTEASSSRGVDRSALAGGRFVPSRVAPLELVGDVAGHDVIVVDDMIDSGKSLERRVHLLKERGAKRVVAYATHPVLSGNAVTRINRCPVSEVIVTNTLPLSESVDMRHNHKIVQLSVAPVLAKAILRIQTSQSLQDMRVFDRDSEKSRYKGQE